MFAEQNEGIKSLEAHLQTTPAAAFIHKWQEWRGTDIAPRRSQIRIEDLGEALPLIILVEFVSPEVCTFVFVGSNLVSIQGSEYTGMNYYDMTEPAERELRIQRMHAQERHPCGSYSILTGALSQGTHLHTELVALPILPNKAGEAAQCLAVCAPLGSDSFYTPVTDAKIIRLSDEFRYIDLGAGLPDENPQDTCLSPLSL